jgi:CheY-like chemotaxis protein
VTLDRPAVRAPTVLVVDDDPLIRRVVRRVLRAYTVLEAATIKEAEAHFTRADPLIELLLSDVVLPDGDGGKLARTARALQPHVRLLFMSGYGPGVLAQYGLPPAALVTKPFTAELLRVRVTEALGQPVQQLT